MITYKEYVELLAAAYVEYAKESEECSYICLVIQERHWDLKEESRVRDLFRRINPAHIEPQEYEEHSKRLISYVKNWLNENSGGLEALHIKPMQRFLNVECTNHNLLRSIFLTNHSETM